MRSMRATTCEVAGPPAVQRDGKTTSSPAHSPANTASLRCSSNAVGAARWSWGMGLAPFDGFHDLLRGVVEIVAGHDVEAGVLDDLLAGCNVGAFEPHHQRHFQADFLDRGDHAFGDDVAFHAAAENVDQDTLHVGIGGSVLYSTRRPFLAD